MIEKITRDDVRAIMREYVRGEAMFHENEVDTRSINKEMGIDRHGLTLAVESAVSEISRQYGISFDEGEYDIDLDADLYYRGSKLFSIMNWFFPHVDEDDKNGKQKLYLEDLVSSIWRAIPEERKNGASS